MSALRSAIHPAIHSAIRSPIASKWGGGFSLDAFMAAQTDGFDFDFTKTDRMFQESTGPTLADDVGEAIGLALDQRTWGDKTLAQVLAGQTELRGTGTTALLGTATAATYNTSTGVGSVSRVDAANMSLVQVAVTANQAYAIDIETGSEPLYLRQVAGFAVMATIPAATRRTVYVHSTGTPVYIGGVNNASTATFTLHSFKLTPGNHATQATGTLRPLRQANGPKFDGGDDRLVSTYGIVGAGDLFAFDYADIPAVISATNILFGTQDGSSNGAYLAITTGGALRVKIGQTVVDSTGVDLRNGRYVIGFYTVGSTVYLVADGVIVGSGVWTGSLPATVWYLGCVNANGTATAFFGGSLLCPLVGRETINLAKANQIRTALLAL